MTDTSFPILSVSGLRSKLKIDQLVLTVVDGLSFNLYKGKTLALVGESGCGKSLTALSIMRILPERIALPSEGEIIYEQKNLLKASEKEMRALRGSKIAMIFQDPASALNPVYTIESQLIEVVEIHLGIYGEQALDHVKKTMEDVGIDRIEDRLTSYPHELSGGLKQRVMIAMALLCSPDILIADEPTTALDVTIQKQILELIKKLQKERGMALLLITHDMGVVREMADEVIVMYLTEGIEKANSKDIFSSPLHPYTKGLFNSRPSLHKKERLIPIKGNVPSLNNIPSGCRFHTRCPEAMPICALKPPPSFNPSKSCQTVKCWLYEGK